MATAPLVAILLLPLSLRTAPVAGQELPGAAQPPAAPAIREPEPSPASLAPIDTEVFRQRYGTTGLFRLRLGVDAAAGSAGEPAERRLCPPTPWPDSAEHESFEKALGASRFHEAGKALGRWRLWRATCGDGGAQGAGGR